MELMPETVVHCNIFNPATSMFKELRKGRAECQTISCTLADCPLLAAKQCMFTPVLGCVRCPYGRYSCEVGPTRRAGSFGKWIRERQDRYQGIGHLGYPAQKMALVGDYVYLPYAHMTMCKAVPFPQHSSMFCSGTPLLTKEQWTLGTVLTLIDFRPRTYIDMKEIVDYQTKSVPLFLVHLRECDPDMWQQLVAQRPELDKAPNHVGRKALIRTLKGDIAWTTSGGHKSEYPVTWRWDGEKVRTCSAHAYSSTWGDIKLAELELTATPDENAAIVVRDNCWVTPDTVFVD